MQRGTAPEGDQGAFSDIQPLFNRMDPCRTGHVLINDFNHRLRAARWIGFQCIAHGSLERLLGGGCIQRDAPACESVSIQPAQYEVGIGHRCPFAAAAIAGRPRFGTRAPRSHRDATQFIHARKRASARTDFDHVDHRDLDGHTAALHEAVRAIDLKGA